MLQLSLLVLTVFAGVECAKILGIFHVAGTSHHLAGSTLMKILAAKGHDVTIISTFTEKNPPKNYREIVLTGLAENLQESMDKTNYLETQFHPLELPTHFTAVSVKLIEDAFNHSSFQKFMKSGETFDAVILEAFNSEAMKYVAHHFNAPLIVYNSIDANEWINPYQGNPDSPSYTANYYLQFPSSDMSFLQRVYNSILYVYANLIRVFYMIPMHNTLLHKYYPNAPQLEDIIYNVSLVLLNADPILNDPLPRVPSIVNIAGFHIKQPQALPKDLQELMDNAKHGVIYFSMGTNVKSKDMSEEKRNLLLKTFSKLKQTVLWKFEDENLPGRPDNVITRKWFPQNDILAHKNVKLFITHGGFFGTMEAVYHGVPLLALPLMVEQEVNSRRATFHGYAKCVRFQELDENTFNSYIQELLQNPKYKENAELRSRILTDKPLPAREAINYWVEYVIRHKGAPHLRVTALNLTWYQYLLLDVVAFLLMIIVVIIYTVKYSFNVVFRRNIYTKEKTT